MDEFIKLQVDRLGITILRVLDEEHHGEGDNSRTCIDSQLLRI